MDESRSARVTHTKMHRAAQRTGPRFAKGLNKTKTVIFKNVGVFWFVFHSEEKDEDGDCSDR